jgi:Uma2 family endonuclease
MNLALAELEFPLRIRPERPMTDEELMRFSAENEVLRVERDANGELIVTAACGSEGGSTELDVAGELRNWARLDGRGKAFGSNAGFTLPDSSIRAADAAWVSFTRWNVLTPRQRKGYAPICPEFIVEVRSEKDRVRPLQAKMKMWLANGVELAWLIDPLRKTVEIYRRNEPIETHHDPTSIQGTGPVRGFELVMANIWP